MIDRDEVVKALEWCQENACEGCPYDTHNNESCGISDDILALLKEQEAVPVIQCEVMHLLMWCCSSCGTAITHGDKFCRMCGRAVNWNA